MPELPPHPTIPDGQSDGRHRRRAVHPEPHPANVHPSHVRLSLIPALLTACLGLCAVTVLVVAGPSSRAALPTLILTAAGAVAVMCGAIIAAERATRREHDLYGRSAADVSLPWRLDELRALVSHGRQELRGLVERIDAGETPQLRRVDSLAAATADPITNTAQELLRSQAEAWNAVVKAANTTPGGNVRRVEVFVNLARRMQTLSHRALQGLDQLENQTEDPGLLKGLFRIDHLSTRLRRQAESLAVIGGSASRRQWTRPIAVYEVLRSAVAEVEHYSRVKVVPPGEQTVSGSAVADLIHLLAELVENATKFSPPHTQVHLRVETVTAGLAIEIEDRGLGIPQDAQHRLNDLLADPEQAGGDELVRDGRIGLLVVSALARRHKVVVRLQTNMFGGTQAVVMVPNELIDPAGEETWAGPTASVDRQKPMPVSTPYPEPSPDTVQALAGPDHDPAAFHPAPRSEGETDPGAALPAARQEARDDLAPPLDGGQRPELPRRRPQANLSPELVDAPRPRVDDPHIDHNPRLMAAFKQGMRRGQDPGLPDGADETDS